MSTNGGNPYAGLSTRELIAQIEREEAAARREEERREIEELQAALRETNARLKALTEPPPRKRSEMTATDISRFIRSHPDGPAAGARAFKELPK